MNSKIITALGINDSSSKYNDTRKYQYFLSFQDLYNSIQTKKIELDVLHVIGSPHASWPPTLWFRHKLARWSQMLQEMDLKAFAFSCGSKHEYFPDHLIYEVIKALGPKMIISRAYSINSEKLGWLALQMPETKFIQMNHTPNSFSIFPKERGLRESLVAIEYAEKFGNFFFGLVSEMDASALQQCHRNSKIIYLPNPCFNLATTKKNISNSNTINIALAGRANFQKNLKNQIDAIALLGQNMPVKVHIFVDREQLDGLQEELALYAKSILLKSGIDFIVSEFLTPEEFSQYLIDHVDILCHVSFDESFGYLVWEALNLGIPVLGSNCMPFASVHAIPTNILNIAESLKNIIISLHHYSREAVEIASRIQKKNNSDFKATIENVFNA